MSEAFDKGRDWERKVFKAMRQVLKIEVKRDSRSGAGFHKADGRDQFALVPLFIECKDHKALNVKTDWRIADGKASHGQAPVVVFPDKEEMLCVMRFSDMLQFIRESWDYRTTVDEFRKPNAINAFVEKVKEKLESGAAACPNGHLTDDHGYCFDKKCKYTRGYRPPKVRK